MNILIVALNFKPMPGGIAEYTHQIAKYLQKAGYNVIVLSKCMPGDEYFDSNCDYEVKRYDYDSLLHKKFTRSYRGLKSIMNIIKKNKINVLISNTLESEAHTCCLVSKYTKIPYCLFTHGLDIKDDLKFRKSLQRALALRGANMVFSNSAYTKAIVQNHGINPEKITILHPGISKEFIKEASSPCKKAKKQLRLQGKQVVLTLARLVERKGIDKVIEAINIVKQKIPNIKYIICGDGYYKDYLEELTCKLELNQYIEFKGYTNEKMKRLYYSAADVFIMANREAPMGNVEGFGIVFLEATVFGIPVIGGKSGGVPDAIMDKKTGLLVDPNNIHEISKTITLLLTDKDYATQLVKSGQDRIIKHFTWDNSVAILRECLRELFSVSNR